MAIRFATSRRLFAACRLWNTCAPFRFVHHWIERAIVVHRVSVDDCRPRARRRRSGCVLHVRRRRRQALDGCCRTLAQSGPVLARRLDMPKVLRRDRQYLYGYRGTVTCAPGTIPAELACLLLSTAEVDVYAPELTEQVPGVNARHSTSRVRIGGPSQQAVPSK
jgi:hypothetical protein